MLGGDGTDVLARLREEWRRLGRTAASRRAVRALRAQHPGVVPVGLLDLTGVVGALEPRGGLDALQRARIVTALLASADDALLRRCLLQTLLPGIVAVARALRFGDGVADDPRTFLADAVSEATALLLDWAGQRRAYAAPDLLAALRCRLRRRLLADKARRAELTAVPDRPAVVADAGQLARRLALAANAGVTDVDLVYARCVLGHSTAELADAVGVTASTLRRRLALAARPFLASPS
jgi:hypothetical protein